MPNVRNVPLRLAIAFAGLLALAGCYGDGYYGGYGGAAYGGGYPSSGVYDGYAGGFGYPSYGWNGGYYYPGAGIYLYDRGGRRHRWNGRGGDGRVRGGDGRSRWAVGGPRGNGREGWRGRDGWRGGHDGGWRGGHAGDGSRGQVRPSVPPSTFTGTPDNRRFGGAFGRFGGRGAVGRIGKR